ncbi:hypothetical protein SCLCIDRAFT_805142 [Scleroderma citrinum Foug A]|uniref:Uncharacterized protein n=1 Tax=Scleroderma citrinum Foug A TaxID=1036808 RepID=A0A0C3E3A6_9AGAM|nr:hypothetical protein SCLCIDRAFT_805142 [Scleroderma citrinum Foug A]
MYIITWTVYQDSPKAFVSTGIGLPILAICGQRVVVDLRRVKPKFYGAEVVSEEVNRQINALSLNIEFTRENDELPATREGDFNPDEEDTCIDLTRTSSGNNGNEA